MPFCTGCAVINPVQPNNLASSLRDYEIAKTPFDSNDPLLAKRAVLISGTITYAKAQTAIGQLAYLDQRNGENISMLINSGGGDGTAFVAITNMIQSIDAKVDTYNIGICGSAAAMLMQSATGNRYALPNTVFIIHQARGKPKELAQYYQQIIEQLFDTCCDLPDEWLPIGNRQFFFDAERAKEYNFVDEVVNEINFYSPLKQSSQ